MAEKKNHSESNQRLSQEGGGGIKGNGATKKKLLPVVIARVYDDEKTGFRLGSSLRELPKIEEERGREKTRGLLVRVVAALAQGKQPARRRET